MSEEREPSQSSSKSPAARHKRRWRWWPAAIILLLVCFGVTWYWWSHRLDFRFIGAYPGRVISIRNDGFLVQSKPVSDQKIGDAHWPATIQFRDWQGRVRWDIHLPVAKGAGEAQQVCKASSDGRFLACATTDLNRPVQQRVLVIIWDEDNEVGRISLPEMGSIRELQVLDNGQALIVGLYNRRMHLYHVSQNTLIAAGSYLVPSTNYSDSITMSFAPDLSCGEIRYYSNGEWICIYTTLQIKDSQLMLIPKYPMKTDEPPMFSYIAFPNCLANGLVMDVDSDAFYGTEGRISAPGHWLTERNTNPNSPWFLQHDGAVFRVFSPVGNQSWPVPLTRVSRQDENWKYNITEDGQYLVLWHILNKSQGRSLLIISDILERYPRFESLSERLKGDNLAFLLYKRPGRLIARVRCPGSIYYGFYYKGHEINFRLFKPYLSNNGRYLVIMNPQIDQPYNYELLVFRR